MRASLWILGIVVVAAAQAAEASTVVVLSDPQTAPALGSALQVTLAGRGVAIATLPPPDGALRLDRAAAAQHAAVQFNADAALWIDSQPDGTEVCAVSADGRFFRHAPLPVGEGDTPRMFATIATSLLDELLAPPDDAPAVDVDVHVHVDPHGGPPSVTPIAAPIAPGLTQAMPAPFDGRPRMDRTLAELGPMLSPVTVGVEAGLMMPLGESWRLGGYGVFNRILTNTDEQWLAGFAGELRHVGRGTHHWDIGAIGGYAFVVERTTDDAPFAGARIAYAWEGPNHGNSISLVPMIFVPEAGEAGPGIYASYRWELPL
jgi:hypothetical protein